MDDLLKGKPFGYFPIQDNKALTAKRRKQKTIDTPVFFRLHTETGDMEKLNTPVTIFQPKQHDLPFWRI